MIPDLMFSNHCIVFDPNEFENSLLNLINEVLKKYCFNRSKEKMDKAKLCRFFYITCCSKIEYWNLVVVSRIFLLPLDGSSIISGWNTVALVRPTKKSL